MRNIHLIPTDKPSRLYLGNNGNFVFGMIQTSIQSRNDDFTNQNIYITSDEEIKEGDWYYDTKDLESLVPIYQRSQNLKFYSGCKKIILTTDGDLISNGVQAIDDEFLEWFVKNPSCEKVEVKRNKKLSNKSIWDAVEGDLVFNNHNCGGVITQLSNDIRVHIISENGEGYMETAITSDNGLDTLVINNYKVYEYSDYKIIIPKEKQKQHLIEMMKSDEELGLYEEPKQETLEHTSKFIVFTLQDSEDWVQYSIPLDSFEKADNFCQQFRDKKMSYLICQTLKQGYNGK